MAALVGVVCVCVCVCASGPFFSSRWYFDAWNLPMGGYGKPDEDLQHSVRNKLQQKLDDIETEQLQSWMLAATKNAHQEKQSQKSCLPAHPYNYYSNHNI